MKKIINQSIVTQEKPLVSVIMPVYNAQDYVEEAIESLLVQTYKHIEIILVDDHSTDLSWEILQEYANKYPNKITAIQTKRQTNAAGNGAMNFGLKIAKGSYIARMDADDISLPTRIEKQVEYLNTHSHIILVGTQAVVINKEGKQKGKKMFPVSHDDIYKQYGILHPIIHPSVMIRRSLLPNKNKIYEMKWDVNDDYYTFFRLLQYGKFHNLPEVLLKYRVHGQNLSLINPKAKFWCSVRIRLAAIKNFHYKMTPKAWVYLIGQCFVISCIPEKLIVPLYLFIRGMAKPETFMISLFPRLKPRVVLQ